MNVGSDQEVRDTYAYLTERSAELLPDARVNGVLVQQLADPGVEVIVGVSHDSQLGPILLFGAGGALAELYDDTALRSCPISAKDALAMIHETKVGNVLDGIRGRPKCDVAALAGILETVSYAAAECHREAIALELDLNPIVVLADGAGTVVLDALARLERVVP